MINHSTNSWSGLTATGLFGESIAYDGNGNILTYNRDGDQSGTPAMDRMTYHYTSGTNRLDHITETVPSGNYSNDMENQSSGYYSYDAIGNLVGEGSRSIDWTVYGKIKQITASGEPTISYGYDAAGNRISKTVGSAVTWYVRDAQGNTLSTYAYDGTTMTASEQYLYGSARVGVFNRNLALSSSLTLNKVTVGGIGDIYSDQSYRGQRQYELSNHLGNVLATISDKKVWNSGTSSFAASVLSVADYYPFGMQMPGRTVSAGGYRYGFNGKENDNEVKGDGNQQDYGMRIYDSRIGKFLSVDPLTPDYPELTPYQFASNRPIAGIDQDGGEFKFYALQWKDNGSTRLKVGDQVKVQDQMNLMLRFKVSDRGQSKIVEIPLTINRSDVGLSGNFVNYNGKSVRIPSEFDLNNLPSQTDPIWETFETADEIDENFIGGVTEIMGNVQNLAALKGIVLKGGSANYLNQKGVNQKVQNLGSLRRKAVSDAWAQEKELVEKTGEGTRRWNKRELAELRNKGKVKGYEGHHINSVSRAPGQAGDANNIEFVKGRKGNLERHGGDFRNETSGELIDRKKILEERLKKK